MNFCQSADIMLSLCGVGVRVRVSDFSSETTRPRDMLFFLKIAYLPLVWSDLTFDPSFKVKRG